MVDSTSAGATAAGSEPLADYAEAMGDVPVLGHLVVYSVFDGAVTAAALELWFGELGLDRALAPAVARPVDAFEKVTGETKVSYSLDAPDAPRRRTRDRKAEVVTLMVRPVAADSDCIVRHLVREVRNEGEQTLQYQTRLAEFVFERDEAPDHAPGAGGMRITADPEAIGRLSAKEGTRVRQVIEELAERYRHRCAYVSGDRLRSLIRKYVEGLNAVRVRPTGGVYFVGRQHEATLAALHELVSRFGAGSHLARVPLPDQAEMREMIVAAWRERAREDLQKLSRDIAAAQSKGASDGVTAALYARFRAMQATAKEHAAILSETLEETGDAMELAELQLRSLLSSE
jgi:hypothetical protein